MVKTHAQQSIWPVSVFGLGFMLLIMGLSGVASIQETRRIHQQILVGGGQLPAHREPGGGNSRGHLRRGYSATGPAARFERGGRELRQPTGGIAFEGRGATLEKLRALRPQQESKVLERLETALRDYWDTAAAEFQESPLKNKPASVRDQFASQSKKIFAVTEELGKLNDENFEARRRELSRAVENLQNDIWETMLTALCLGAIIAGASVFRISSLEKESAEYQTATKQAEGALAAPLPATGFVAGTGTQGPVA